MNCILTITLLVHSSTFVTKETVRGTYEGSTPTHYIIDFSSYWPAMNKPVHVPKALCEKAE